MCAGAAQAFPQLPQFEVLVFRLTSQPSSMLLLQLPYPAVQVGVPHVPAAQWASVWLGLLQAVAQFPQCAGSFVRLASQPSPAPPLQLPNPESHVTPHTLAVHLAVPWGLPPRLQGLHEPQCDGSLVVAVSHPLPAFPSQLPHPEAQLIPQVEPEHVGVPFTLLQTPAQDPQWAGSVLKLTSQPLAALPSQSP